MSGALRAACALVGLLAVLAQPAAAQSVEAFYKGRTVTMLVGTAPGGINDLSARLVARHLGRFIPGNPFIVVQTQPGAGGLVAANRLYREAALEASNKLSEQAKDEAADADERQQATWRALGQSLAGAAKPSGPKADKSCSWVDSSTECSTH